MLRGKWNLSLYFYLLSIFSWANQLEKLMKLTKKTVMNRVASIHQRRKMLVPIINHYSDDFKRFSSTGLSSCCEWQTDIRDATLDGSCRLHWDEMWWGSCDTLNGVVRCPLLVWHLFQVSKRFPGKVSLFLYSIWIYHDFGWPTSLFSCLNFNLRQTVYKKCSYLS